MKLVHTLLISAVTIMSFSFGNSIPANPPEDCGCTKEALPECSRLGHTYMNKCLRECEGVQFEFKGTCGDIVKPNPTCACPQIFVLECGKDGKTYPSKCVRECHKVEKLLDGPCPKTPRGRSCACPLTEAYECSTAGKTYLNKCVRECDEYDNRLLHDGPCKSFVMNPPTCKCSKIYRPVCGIDQKTYQNFCGLKCAGVKKAVDGTCGVADPSKER